MIQITDAYVGSLLAKTTLERIVLARRCHDTSRRQLQLLPAFVRYYDTESQTLVFERSPEERLIRFDGEIYQVQLPWMIYVVCLSDIKEFYLFFNNSQLSSLDDEIYPACIPNVAYSGKFCAVKDNQVVNLQAQINAIGTLRNRVALIVNTVWDSIFNEDYELHPSLLPTFVPQESIKDKIDELTLAGENDTDVWHLYLKWWEETVDLYTAIKWEAPHSEKLSSILPPKLVIPEDSNAGLTENLTFQFFQQFYKSVG